jgi:hypothetical protein
MTTVSAEINNVYRAATELWQDEPRFRGVVQLCVGAALLAAVGTVLTKPDNADVRRPAYTGMPPGPPQPSTTATRTAPVPDGPITPFDDTKVRQDTRTTDQPNAISPSTTDTPADAAMSKDSGSADDDASASGSADETTSGEISPSQTGDIEIVE